ncbi:MAG: DUF3237 family protein [Actinomycetota bacterium]|nr:DUF3237 family protein [Actinomycetota bacterium]
MTYQTDPDIAGLFATFDPPPAALFDESVDLQTKVDLLREGSRRDSEGSAQRPFAGTIEPIELAGRSGPIAARLYRPAALATGVRGVAVWFYGGGMMLGDLDKAHHDAAELAEVAGVPVITATYRLAPEHPFPAGVEDAFDAVAFIARNGERWGINTGRIAVGGESAGGAMATAAALQSVGVEDVNVVFQLLAYPKIDFVRRYPSMDEMAAVGIPETMARVFNAAYLPDDADRSHPLATPVDADLTGMPGGIILSAEGDTLRDEAEEYGRRLRAAGAPVATIRAIGQLHGFCDHTEFSPAARIITHGAYRELGAALTRASDDDAGPVANTAVTDTTLTDATAASAQASPVPTLRPVVRLHVLVDDALEVGGVAAGTRRVIPITGGSWTAVGPDDAELTGEVVPGGADWSTEHTDGIVRVEARYSLRAHDGSLVDVSNQGWVRGASARTAAQLEAPSSSPLAHLTRRTLLGTIAGAEGGVLVELFASD